jgi:hypothetical protein
MSELPDGRKVVSLEKGRRDRARREAKHQQGIQKARRRSLFRKVPAALVIAIAVVAVVAGVFIYDGSRYAKQFGSWELAFKHMAAGPNCDSARRVGLADARKGQPGYYPKHDADKDGIACEPYPK